VNPELVYTKHQTARGARADAEVGDKLYLIKNVSELRLTYQIRLLAYAAQSNNKRLVIRLPKQARVHKSLSDFVREFDSVRIERM
jgi:hypothetical protein